uniref:Hexosyltransferase n=1 Tax=Syphacia muris TaxID=451379 RepID=A0A0N5AYB5_9BILA
MEMLYLKIENHFREKVYYESVPLPFNYTHYDFLIQPIFNNRSAYCLNVPVFYVIRSHPDKTEERYFIRTTWAANLKNSIIFVLGRPESSASWKIINQESSIYGDLLVIDMLDSYKNLSIKSVAILRWISRFCHAPSFFFQGDPDVAVFTTSVSDVLKTKDNKVPRIYGYCWESALVFRDGRNKWSMKHSIYSSYTYPRYVAGAAWMFSPAVPAMLLQVLNTPRPYFHIDDVLITGLLAERANIPRECIGGVGYPHDFYDITKCVNPPLMAIFQLTQAQILNALKKVKQGILKC